MVDHSWHVQYHCDWSDELFRQIWIEKQKYPAVGYTDASRFSNIQASPRPCSVMAWNPQHQWLSSSGTASEITLYDHRAPIDVVSRFAGHTGEVCGLKWNHDGSTLASGGNDSCVCIWDATMSQRGGNFHHEGTLCVEPRLRLTQHKAAVKALAWCPFRRDVLQAVAVPPTRQSRCGTLSTARYSTPLTLDLR